MKPLLAQLILLCAASSAGADEPWEGRYTDGKVTLTRSVGDRGGDEFESSKCAGKTFRPRLDPKTDAIVGKDKAYTIATDAQYTRLIVQGAKSLAFTSTCMMGNRA